ncbi:MAG TPA: winged helix-turn-helix domain-containing protein, partial [Rheinheimera sp.]|nr:winged helix-turn-helix domain-containing protein [Rheinheimera sp.]
MLIINGRALNLTTGELTYLGETILLEAKVLAVFKALYASRGELVSQETLFAQVWGDSIVAPNALQRCIAQLRKHLGDEHKNVLQTFPKKGYRLQPIPGDAPVQSTQYRFYFAVALPLILGVALLLTVLPAQRSYQLSTIQPITYGVANEQHGTLTHDQLFYIERAAATATLIRKNLHTEQSTPLHSAADYYGIPGISPDGSNLAIVALTVRPNKQKCTQLISLQLSNANQTTMHACPPFAVQQLHWVSNNRLLAVSREHIVAVDPDSKTLGADLLPIKLQQISGSYWQGSELYVMGLDQQSIPTLWLFAYKVQTSQLSLIKQTTLPYTPDQPAYFSVAQDGTLIQQHQGRVYIYQDLRLRQTLASTEYQQLHFTAAAAPDQWLASRLLTDKQVALLDTNNSRLAATPFDEQDAQFQPDGEHIAFISNRSGQQELWLQQAGAAKRVSSGQYIRSFVWQQDGQAIWTLGAEHINKQQFAAQSQRLIPADGLEVLLQHISTSTGEFLLALNKSAQLMLIDVNRQTQQQLFSGAVHWAQLSNSGQVFIATPDSPGIKLLENGRLTEISALQQQRLQWRFYWRGDQLLFADKQQRIMAYHPQHNEVQELGQYTADYAVATDLQAVPLRILANTT